MESLPLLVSFSSFLLFLLGSVQSSNPSALFVFGYSYVDTGNHNKTKNSWHTPYGITFPGKPTGRYSDGRVLTDFVASYFHIPTPVAYRHRKHNPSLLALGINFAYGSAGVFNTLPGVPNASTQIGQLKNLIGEGLYSRKQLSSSLVLLSVSGNDYIAYLITKGSYKGIPSFRGSLIRQVLADLESLYKIGLRKFAITAMEPFGCWPWISVDSSYRHCNHTLNQIAVFHNILLKKAVEGFRETRPDASLVILDQYTSFMSILNHPNQSGKFKDPLRPCCDGKRKIDFCANVNKEGQALYTLCSHRESAFFWDGFHPTQAAWQTMMKAFDSSLHLLL
eukprot:Gb_40024 [translate_table: standard]